MSVEKRHATVAPTDETLSGVFVPVKAERPTLLPVLRLDRTYTRRGDGRRELELYLYGARLERIVEMDFAGRSAEHVNEFLEQMGYWRAEEMASLYEHPTRG